VLGATAPLRVVIVDDEPLARRGVRARLLALGDVEIVGECASGREAVRDIPSLAPELVFLDVQMPGLGGFDVIAELGPERMPPVVFVTAFDAHALRAFEAHALDYLLKPIDDERFAAAVARARRRVLERRAGAMAGELASALAELRRGGPQPIAVRDRGRVLLLDPREIDWLEAEGDYVRLHVGDRAHLHRATMASMEELLDPRRFARVHRSAIVNVARVRALRPRGDREYTVVLHGGAEIPLSRGCRDRVRALLGDVV
jgi:two-component system, LytTR family, response regulator